MSTVSVVLAFLSGGAVGSVATAFFTTSHERTERFRDRMLAAAEQLLLAEEQTELRIREARAAAAGYRDARDRTLRAADSLGAEVDAPEESATDQQQPDEDSDGGSESGKQVSVDPLLSAAAELVGVANFYIEVAPSVGGEPRLTAAEDNVRGLLASDDPDRGPVAEGIRSFATATLELSGWVRLLLDAQRASVDAANAAYDAIARIRILFARGGDDDPVTRAATDMVTRLSTFQEAALAEYFLMPKSIDGADGVDETPANADALAEAEAEAWRELRRSVSELASAVSARIRRRWL